MEQYEYYTDGAATMKKDNEKYIRVVGGWSYVKIRNGHINYVSYGGELEATNNSMELYAIYAALRDCKEKHKTATKITIYTDSAYCFNIYTNWAKNWENNDWTRGKKREKIENVDLIKSTWTILKELNSFLEIDFKKVKGHSNNKYNELADKYAVKGKELSKQGYAVPYPGHCENSPEV